MTRFWNKMIAFQQCREYEPVRIGKLVEHTFLMQPVLTRVELKICLRTLFFLFLFSSSLLNSSVI